MRLQMEEIHPWHRNEAQRHIQRAESKYKAFEQVIGKGLRPRFIAEVGTHCGYAASMFMRQVPLALFFGLSYASSLNGKMGPVGAEWANKLLKPYKHAHLVLWDYKHFSSLPLSFQMDFIHINTSEYAEQVHLLNIVTKYIKKGGYILIDQGVTHFSGLENQEIILDTISQDILFKPNLNGQEN